MTTKKVWFLNDLHRGADKFLARPTSRCILFDGENISFDASLINRNNIPPIMIIKRIYQNQNLLSLQLASFLVRLRTYHHPCTSIKVGRDRAVGISSRYGLDGPGIESR